MREGAVGVRERGIYIKYWWDKGGLLVWDGVADSRTKKEGKERRKRDIHYGDFFFQTNAHF